MLVNYNFKNKAPCYQCEDRVVNSEFNCHTECEKYNTWKKDYRDNKRAFRQQIDPPMCRYFKETRGTAKYAEKSKRVYR